MSEKGITLVEILVVIFIIAALLTILVSDFPKIQRQFALSRATYKFAQDLRKAQDMALSGEEIKKPDGTIISVKGYGIYIDNRGNNGNNKEYKIYADLDDNARYTSEAEDYTVNTIDLNKDAPGVYIKDLYMIDNNYVSINFNPPNPAISISNLSAEADRAGIIFGLESDPENSINTRTVYIWKSGLIEARNNETFKF
ncbi:MAG: hypothetical protein A3G45_01380 [Candidatus Staskawiczbacteria bacterium RIFCSPLOWO2_12_FULL_37_15]|uniref:General secretion pathway GspH domain-containing protein n=1 Tax=Candidatus Staskawiczbacteria bacterium RIFCSPLOWO2_12_FULL_37_15 TaxID=1802218 RepID=A0A1G2ISB2_9BACT|nr:MAG: hypothetical protein A3G45_01380 [Candidatus Staskawiczbacteria bacterium RIFCSPLOWO2_12_FULL_37_15]